MQRFRPILTALALLVLTAAIPAAELPRKAPDLAISMNGANPTQLSQYKGKVVVLGFILTGCPHCQKTTGFLIKLQNELGPKGFQALESSIEQGAALAVPKFIVTFNPPFPVGYNDFMAALNFMQHPPMLNPMMPMLAFIDRQGNIREQHEGDDAAFFGDQQEQNLRARVEFYLNESAGAGKKSAKKAVTAKKQSD